MPLSGSVLTASRCHIAPVGRVSRQLHHPALAPVLEVFISSAFSVAILMLRQKKEMEWFNSNAKVFYNM